LFASTLAGCRGDRQLPTRSPGLRHREQLNPVCLQSAASSRLPCRNYSAILCILILTISCCIQSVGNTFQFISRQTRFMCGLGSSPFPAFIGSIEHLANLPLHRLAPVCSRLFRLSSSCCFTDSPVDLFLLDSVSNRVTRITSVCFFVRVSSDCGTRHYSGHVCFVFCSRRVFYRASSSTKTPVNGSFASDLHTEF